MNQRNVDALVKLLEGIPIRFTNRWDERVIAEWLADQGALAPEALTPSDIARCAEAWEDVRRPEGPEGHGKQVAVLARIAKGEDE